MKKLLITSFIGLSILSNAQVTRFVYQASMKLNTEKSDKSTENVYLEVSPEKSLFFSENTVKRDSVMDRMRQTRTFSPDAMQNYRSTVTYTIEKDLVNQTVMYSDRIGRDNYMYVEEPKMEWKILPETVTIGEYKTQKAETNYGGRVWNAWFTTQLPYQDGPYKFSGLPGLIIKLEDTSGDYSFDLKETKKIADFTTMNTGFGGQKVKVTKDKYLQLLKNYQKDPVGYMSANMRSGGGPGGGGGQRGPGGGMRPGAGGMGDTQRREMEKRMTDEIKNNNNPIELK